MFPRKSDSRMRRVEFELRSTGVKLDTSNPLRTGTHSRGYLPHVKREGARYFVTFRLEDSLPKAVLLKIQAERAERIRRLEGERQPTGQGKEGGQHSSKLLRIERDYFRKLETFLDRGRGACWLKRPDIATVVADAVRYFDGERYRLDAWVVMPNHVHVVLWPMPNHALSRIVQSWKRFTGREANRILGRTGMNFRQPESYDHWIRNDEEHARCCRYLIQNPVKARLCVAAEDWEWSSAWRKPKAA